MKKYSFRKFINDIHLWLGIGSGIIIFIICLSGTILVFEKEIEALFAEDVKLTGEDLPVKSLEELENSISEAGLGQLTGITIDPDAEGFYEAQIKTSPEDRRGTTFLVNPHTAEVISAPESAASDFMFSMFKLHRWLLLDSSIGRPIVGVATIIFMFLAISGLILWFPKKWRWRNFRQGFKIKTKANWKRINHDLHNTLGFYSLLLIVIMGLTGLCWSFEWYREAAGEVLGTKIFNRGGGLQFNPDPIPDAEIANLDQIYSQIQTEFPYEGKVIIGMATEDAPVYNVRKYDASSFSPVIADQLVVDRSGEVLHKDIFTEKPLNVQVASLIKPIHLGEIYGNFSRVLYFIACLIATSLPVTGTIIWINKLRKKSAKKSKKRKPKSATAFARQD